MDDRIGQFDLIYISDWSRDAESTLFEYFWYVSEYYVCIIAKVKWMSLWSMFRYGRVDVMLAKGVYCWF